MKTVNGIAADLIIEDLMPRCRRRNLKLADTVVKPEEIAFLARLIHDGKLSRRYVRDAIRMAIP